MAPLEDAAQEGDTGGAEVAATQGSIGRPDVGAREDLEEDGEEEVPENEVEPDEGAKPLMPRPDQDLTKDPQYDVHRAAAKGDLEELRRLAAAGADLNVAAVTEGSYVPLDVAATTQPKAAMELLRLGADATLCGSAVVAAASWGHEELLGELLKLGGNPGQKMGTATALRWSVQRCNEECALLLLDAGAWDAEDEDGELAEDHDTLLRRALSRGMRRLVARIAEEHPEFVKGYDLRSSWEVWSDRWQALQAALHCGCRNRQRPAPTPAAAQPPAPVQPSQ